MYSLMQSIVSQTETSGRDKEDNAVATLWTEHSATKLIGSLLHRIIKYSAAQVPRRKTNQIRVQKNKLDKESIVPHIYVKEQVESNVSIIENETFDCIHQSFALKEKYICRKTQVGLAPHIC